jgi:hypothetical protein
MTSYEVYQPHVPGPEGINSAWVISRHRSPEAAQRAMDRALRRLRRQPGNRNSWLDWRIRERDTSAATFSVRPYPPDEGGK